MVVFACALIALNLHPVHAKDKIRIVHTTDIHGWLMGHPHQPWLDADFGDFVSLTEHLSRQSIDNNDDFFMFDSGDLIEGTGLSDATPIHGYVCKTMLNCLSRIAAIVFEQSDISTFLTDVQF
jgi:2',3'-cyclic-nucleotide 2'-phosphodiesterase (5'-nucleotidase family)